MGVQLSSDGGACYVLGVFDQSVVSSSWTVTSTGVDLVMKNGSPSNCPTGSPRELTVSFKCQQGVEAPADNTWDATNPSGTCNYNASTHLVVVTPILDAMRASRHHHTPPSPPRHDGTIVHFRYSCQIVICRFFH